MFAMFKALFAAISVLFGAAEKGAKAIDHLAEWCEETSGSFADEARLQRQHRVNELLSEYGLEALPKAAPKVVIAEAKVKRSVPAISA